MTTAAPPRRQSVEMLVVGFILGTSIGSFGALLIREHFTRPLLVLSALLAGLVAGWLSVFWWLFWSPNR